MASRWELEETRQLFKIYMNFRDVIIKSKYPTVEEVKNFIELNSLNEIKHSMLCTQRRLKNVAKYDELVVHKKKRLRGSNMLLAVAKEFFPSEYFKR